MISNGNGKITMNTAARMRKAQQAQDLAEHQSQVDLDRAQALEDYKQTIEQQSRDRIAGVINSGRTAAGVTLIA